MPRFDLTAARAAALRALGRNAQKTLDLLEAAGLTVVLTAELPPTEPHVRQLHDVALYIPDEWREPYKITVDHGSDLLVLNAAPEAVPGIREAVMVRRVMGGRVDVEVDDAEGLVIRAWVVE